MRRLEIGAAMIVLLATAACAGRSGTLGGSGCSTTIDLNVSNGGGLSIPDPPKLVCAPDDTINITFWNHDTKQHEFLIFDIGCNGDKASGKNPTKGLLGHPTMVSGGTSAQMNPAPTMLTKDQIKTQICGGSAPYLYSYTIKVPGVKDKDPDLEVSPPPPLQ